VEAFVFASAVMGGAIASVSGFGIGSFVTPLMALILDARVAVAAVAIPHVIGTALRYSWLKVGADRRVLLTFGTASAAGALAGALLQPRTSSRGIALLFGTLLILVAVLEWTGATRRLRFVGRTAWLAGLGSGVLGGLAGNQGGIRSAALLGFDLRRDVFVATATAIALVIDAARLPIYVLNYSNEFYEIWRVVVIACVGVIVGTALGGHVLTVIPERWFRSIVATILALLGLSMILRA
jgi:hypothetical protein